MFKRTVGMADGTVTGVKQGDKQGDKKVTFGDSSREIEDNGEESEYAESSGEESFYEIATSEPESLSSSDENVAEELEMVLHLAYTSSPQKFRSDPVMRNSLLLWDKDLLDSDEGMTRTCLPLAMVLFTFFVNLAIGMDSSDDSSVLATSLDSEGYIRNVDIDDDDASIVGEMSSAKIDTGGCGGSNCDTEDEEIDAPKSKKRKKSGDKSSGDVRKRTRGTTKVCDARGSDARKAKVGKNQEKGSDKQTSATQEDTTKCV